MKRETVHARRRQPGGCCRNRCCCCCCWWWRWRASKQSRTIQHTRQSVLGCSTTSPSIRSFFRIVPFLSPPSIGETIACLGAALPTQFADNHRITVRFRNSQRIRLRLLNQQRSRLLRVTSKIALRFSISIRSYSKEMDCSSIR